MKAKIREQIEKAKLKADAPDHPQFDSRFRHLPPDIQWAKIVLWKRQQMNQTQDQR
jgi:hypothetical protein